MTTNIWDNLPRPFFVLAPMEAVTDTVFRHVVQKAAAPDVFFTEFTNATGWVHAGEKAVRGRLFKTDDEHPIIAQIWGGEVSDMSQLAAHCRDLGYDGIDINMGCPAKRAVKSGGSALIRDPELAASAIAAAKTAGLPVSVKTRLGYTHIDEWRDWLTHLFRQDIVNLTIHLRTKKEMSKVPAHHELIPEIVALRNEIAPQTLLTINGDVVDRAHGLQLVHQFPGVDGIMIGRGIFQDPFCFAKDEVRETSNETRKNSEVSNAPAHNSYLVSRDSQQLLKLLHYQLDLYDQYQPELTRPFDTLKRFFKIYVRDFDGASDLRTALMMTHNTNEVRELLDNFKKSRAAIEITETKGYTTQMSDTIKAIVFDSDGTLLDTRNLIFEGFKTVLRSHNLAHLATDQYIRQRLGKPTAETFEQIIAGHDTGLSPQTLARELDDVQNQNVKNIVAYPHTLELLETWKNKGVKLCLFTSGYSYMIDRNYAAAGIPHVRELFDAIVTADDGLAHKPEPDAILELLRRVDVEPQDAIVVGDHAFDIISGKRARLGLKVGILHGIGTQHELLNAGADFLCDNLESLNRLMSFAKR